MAKIGLTEGFTLIPEGTHVFQITDVKYKEDFGKLEVYMQTQTGSKHIERFSLLKSDGSPNEGAYNSFSYFNRQISSSSPRYTLSKVRLFPASSSGPITTILQYFTENSCSISVHGLLALCLK